MATPAPIRGANRIVVINTEKHFDHILGNSYFREQGCSIWAHPGVHRSSEEFQWERADFNRHILDPIRQAAHEEEAFFADTEIANPDQALHDGQRFGLAEIVFTPGHTPTNLSVWIASEGVLYTGDCLINRYAPTLEAGGPADWQIWLHSLDCIEALKPEILMAGHGPVARGPEVAIVIENVRRHLKTALART